MRTKDEQKKQALFQATIKLVNEIGFASSSVSKIAKQARVSPSTIYVFFKNKEDLIVSTYLEVKHRLCIALLADFDDSLPIRDIIHRGWCNVFHFISANLEAYGYMEQFANSPYSELVDQETIEKEFQPFIDVVERGIAQKIIKDVNRNLIAAFLFHPISRLANPRLCRDEIKMDSQTLNMAFSMAWDAIKL